MLDEERRLLSYPMKVHWAGWESDTYRLQQAGWSISANQDVCRMQIRLAIRHDAAQMRGLSAGVDYDYYAMNKVDYRTMMPVIPFNVMGRDVRVTEFGDPAAWGAYQPIDAMPQFVERRVSRLDDLVHFAPSLARTQQIILPEDSVPELLERIRKLQEPARIERLKASLDADRDGILIAAHPRQKFHAQILSIAA